MATYNDAILINASIRYAAKGTSPIPDETWSTSVKVGVFESLSTPDYGAGMVTLPGFAVNDASVTRDITDFDVAQGFTGSGGAGTITDSDQDDIALALAGWATALKAELSNLYELESIRLYPIGQDGKSRTAPSIYSPKAAVHDPTGTDAMPQDVASIASLYTATRGPKGRGRMYIGGLTQSWLGTLGNVQANRITISGNATKALCEAIAAVGGVGPGYRVVIWHRATDTASVVQRVRVNDRFDTQRRRDSQITPTWTDFVLA